jgi:mannosyltransferase OCH1-like enzyme
MSGDRQATDRPAVIHYWHEKIVPDDVARFLATFPEKSPDFRQLTFNESTAEALIATHLGSREAMAFHACAVPAMQADYFRYCAVYALGGVYCDADSRCLGSLSPLLDIDQGELFEGPERGHLHNELFTFLSPGHPLLRLTIDIATMNIEHRIWDVVWMATGPWIFRELVRMWRSPSIDTIFEHARSSPHFANDARRLRYFDALQERVGDDAQLGSAFEGVCVSPLSMAQRLVQHGGSQLEYKRSESHFPNFMASIYRPK